MKKKLLPLLLVTLCVLSKESYAQVTFYAPIPYTTGFESGTLDANWFTTSSATGGRIQIWNSTSLTWNSITAVAHTDSLWLGLDNSPGGTYITNEAWFGLNLNGKTNVRFGFWWAEWNDELEPEDGVYISDNGGTTFTKVIDLNGPSYTDLQWNGFDVSLDSINTLYSLNFTSTYVIKLQQRDNYYFAGGNDGFLFDDINVYQPCTTTTSGTMSPTACDTFVSPSGNYTWTTSNTYMDTIINSFGCDSIITINLTINNSTSGIDTRTACDSLTWIDGLTYVTSNNTATFNLVNGNSVGCDSLVTLNLTINTVNTTVTNTSPTLTANQAGANYRWLDCNNNNAVIPGEISQSYTATVSGNFAVEITLNNCIDTSACENIIVSDVEEKTTSLASIYPNPTKDYINITLNSINNIYYTLSNVEGKILINNNLINHKTILVDLTQYPKGLYLLKVTDNDTSQTFKINKQ
jgi:hypothetical protein